MRGGRAKPTGRTPAMYARARFNSFLFLALRARAMEWPGRKKNIRRICTRMGLVEQERQSRAVPLCKSAGWPTRARSRRALINVLCARERSRGKSFSTIRSPRPEFPDCPCHFEGELPQGAVSRGLVRNRRQIDRQNIILNLM